MGECVSFLSRIGGDNVDSPHARGLYMFLVDVYYGVLRIVLIFLFRVIYNRCVTYGNGWFLVRIVRISKEKQIPKRKKILLKILPDRTLIFSFH